MVDFSYIPTQYYASPVVGKNTVRSPDQILADIAERSAVGINAATYDPSPYSKTPPGSVGYRLPAQSYINYNSINPAYYGTPTLKTALINTAVNVGANVIGAALGLTDPSATRLYNNGLNYGATPSTAISNSNGASNVAFADGTDTRVTIYDNTGLFIKRSRVFAPLYNIGGVMFPYTPQISVTHKANYDVQHLVHTNYGIPQYQHSGVDSISISGEFTANTPAEAEYVAAMMHFFRSATKMFYGQDQIAGTPPPVLTLDGHGPYLFDLVPVVVSSFDYSMPTDVDYISCSIQGEKQRIPTLMNIQLSLIPTYSRRNISNNFGLDAFSKGQLIVGTNGTDKGAGGFI